MDATTLDFWLLSRQEGSPLRLRVVAHERTPFFHALFPAVAVGFALVSSVSVTVKLPTDSLISNFVMDIHSSSETASLAVMTKAPMEVRSS